MLKQVVLQHIQIVDFEGRMYIKVETRIYTTDIWTCLEPRWLAGLLLETSADKFYVFKLPINLQSGRYLYIWWAHELIALRPLQAASRRSKTDPGDAQSAQCAYISHVCLE